jgi:hypothetical protein
VDLNIEIDELVVDDTEDAESVADRIRTATEGALPPDAARTVGRALLDAASDKDSR